MESVEGDGDGGVNSAADDGDMSIRSRRQKGGVELTFTLPSFRVVNVYERGRKDCVPLLPSGQVGNSSLGACPSADARYANSNRCSASPSAVGCSISPSSAMTNSVIRERSGVDSDGCGGAATSSTIALGSSFTDGSAATLHSLAAVAGSCSVCCSGTSAAKDSLCLAFPEPPLSAGLACSATHDSSAGDDDASMENEVFLDELDDVDERECDEDGVRSCV